VPTAHLLRLLSDQNKWWELYCGYVLEGGNRDAEAAYRLYSEAYAEPVKAKDAAQSYYQGINKAFLKYFWKHDPELARRAAARVLKHFEDAPESEGHCATEGKAHLLLGNLSEALEFYNHAVRLHIRPVKVPPWSRRLRSSSDRWTSVGWRQRLRPRSAEREVGLVESGSDVGAW
jgi:tetratricopeptide (TPR) repeat protein